MLFWVCLNPDPIKVQLLYISNIMKWQGIFKAPSSIKFVTSFKNTSARSYSSKVRTWIVVTVLILIVTAMSRWENLKFVVMNCIRVCMVIRDWVCVCVCVCVCVSVCVKFIYKLYIIIYLIYMMHFISLQYSVNTVFVMSYNMLS